MDNAILVLEDGTVLRGIGFGAATHGVFELVFNTSMIGYQEIITDASYRGQGIVFTAPHIGNVGVNEEDFESGKPQISACIVRSLSPSVSNWRAQKTLGNWLEECGVPGITDVDTRYLTRKIRDKGTMKAGISTDGMNPKNLANEVDAWSGLDGKDMVRSVTTDTPYHWQPDQAQEWVKINNSSVEFQHKTGKPLSIIVIDYGVKTNILRYLWEYGTDIHVVPASFSCDEIMAFKPDGIVLSNGPGDPKGIPYAIQTVKELLKHNLPIFGICLGHQLIGLALGGETERLKFGHHGGNHPVQDLATSKTMVTSQNHNYVVTKDSLEANKVEVTHISLNDMSIEGMALKDKPVFSVQFHPEASPGPHDAYELFGKFIRSAKEGKFNDG